VSHLIFETNLETNISTQKNSKKIIQKNNKQQQQQIFCKAILPVLTAMAVRKKDRMSHLIFEMDLENEF